MNEELPDDFVDEDEDDFIECGKPVYYGDELVGYCVRHADHVGPCANIILLR